MRQAAFCAVLSLQMRYVGNPFYVTMHQRHHHPTEGESLMKAASAIVASIIATVAALTFGLGLGLALADDNEPPYVTTAYYGINTYVSSTGAFAIERDALVPTITISATRNGTTYTSPAKALSTALDADGFDLVGTYAVTVDGLPGPGTYSCFVTISYLRSDCTAGGFSSPPENVTVQNR